jgi:hypothetical protein
MQIQFDWLNTLFILFGLYTVLGMLLRPDFYWNRRRMRQARQLLGDTRTRILYMALGAIALVVGVAGTLGLF